MLTGTIRNNVSRPPEMKKDVGEEKKQKVIVPAQGKI